MKISNSKKQLARIISENGGWRDGAESAAQCIDGEISFWHDTATKQPGENWCGNFLGEKYDIEFTGVKLPNWSQTILSRNEYFHLYPAAETALKPEVQSEIMGIAQVGDINVVESKPSIEQLAAMGEHMSEQAAQPLCMAKRIEELESQVRVMAELLRDAQRYVQYRLDYTECDARIVMGLIYDIESALAVQVLEPFYYMRDNHTFKRLSDDVDTAITEIEAELDAGWTS